jgi:hypothetical protein
MDLSLSIQSEVQTQGLERVPRSPQSQPFSLRLELQSPNVAENLTLIMIIEMSENVRLPFDTIAKIESVEQSRF